MSIEKRTALIKKSYDKAVEANGDALAKLATLDRLNEFVYTLDQAQAEQFANTLERSARKDSMRIAHEEQLKRAREILAGMNKDIPLLEAGENGAIELDSNNPSHREWYEDGEDSRERESIGYLAVMTTHICSKVNHGGLLWQTWLRREEVCPMCGEMELS